MQYKGVLEEVLANLRCIDVTGNEQVDSYVDDSIRIIKESLDENKDTAQEESVQEQYRFVPTDSSGIIYQKDEPSIKCPSN